MSDPLRIVLIGAGGFNRHNHAPTMQLLAQGPEPALRLEAVCDLDEGRARAFCDDFGFKRAYTNLDRMIDEVQPEAIYSLVQPGATAEVVGRVIPRGLPVFTEKPPGVSIAQARKLAKLAQEHGIISYVAFNRRRAPGLERLKSWCLQNAPVRHLAAQMLRNRRREAEFGIGTAIHPLDCLRFLGGEVDSVETLAVPYPEPPARDFLVRLHFRSGTIADLYVLVDCGLLREHYLATAENAAMEATLGAGYSSDFVSPRETAYADNAVTSDAAAQEDRLLAGGFMGEHRAFIAAVRSGQMPDCCLQDAQHSLELAVAVFEGYSGALSDFVPSADCPYA